MTIDPRASLKSAYDAAADLREGRDIQPWKQAERARFLALLQHEGAKSLLEVGAGTGVHGRWFADQGLRVVATDLSPRMVENCRAKGLDAYEMDFLSLKFADPFDAVFGMNCLLHVPRPELREVLESIRACLRPGGLGFLGQYGGIDRAGVWDGDSYQPKRYFSYLSDEAMQAQMGAVFDVIDFRSFEHEPGDEHRFQAFTIRRA